MAERRGGARNGDDQRYGTAPHDHPQNTADQGSGDNGSSQREQHQAAPAGLAFLAVDVPGADLEAGRLPQHLDDGAHASLLVLWAITDCEALVEGHRPRVELGTAVGTTARTDDLLGSSPAFDRSTLAEAGICGDPAP